MTNQTGISISILHTYSSHFLFVFFLSNVRYVHMKYVYQGNNNDDDDNNSIHYLIV